MTSIESEHGVAAPKPAKRDTRARILAAARDEISVHGVAGARVDRIAALARTSKERLYFYFRNKAAIVAAVAADNSAAFESRVPLDPTDIIGFVGALFDFYGSQPEQVRLWLHLLLDVGGEEVAPDDPRLTWLRERAEVIREAQAIGTVHPGWDPVMLFELLSSLAASWVTAPLYVHRLTEFGAGERSLQRHRDTVLAIARRMIRKAPNAA
ncbi:MAG: hypothetical protein JWM75_495 [Sphingomonas bacterium]|nr:hypothetical protein [Sphingomonas bacterium]